MKIIQSKKSFAVVVVVLALAVGGVVTYKLTLSKASGSIATTPITTTAAPAGLVSATAPTTSGELWVLVNKTTAANVQLMNTKSATPLAVYPVSNAATSIASNGSTLLAVAQATARTGAVSFYDSSNFKSAGTVALPGPATEVVAGPIAQTFYALVSVNGVDSVDVLNASTHRITLSDPLPASTDSMAVSPDGSTLYALQGNGTVSFINLANGKVTQSFGTSNGARQLAISPDGTKLFELKGSHSDNNVGVLNIATEAQLYVLPAPANCVQVTVDPSGSLLYDFVGTPQYGNIQVFNASK